MATGDRQRVGVWEVARGEKVTEFDLPDGGYVKSFRFSNDGRMLAAIGSNSGATLRVFQVLPAFVDPRKAD